jgi:hypothetical protein
MRTTLSFVGATELILQKAVDLGIARSKTEALRMGIFALNKEYSIVKDLEAELVARKIESQEKEMLKKNQRYLTEDEALSKYR